MLLNQEEEEKQFQVVTFKRVLQQCEKKLAGARKYFHFIVISKQVRTQFRQACKGTDASCSAAKSSSKRKRKHTLDNIASTFQNLDRTCPERRFPPAFQRGFLGQKSYYSKKMYCCHT